MPHITLAQLQTIQTILTSGGAVVAHMGKAKPGFVNKNTVNRMITAGWLRCMRGVLSAAGPTQVDLEVTAAGCDAMRDSIARDLTRLK